MASPLKFGVFSALKGVRDERAGKAAQQAELTRKRTLEDMVAREHAEDRQRQLEDVLYSRSQRPATERSRAAQTAVDERTANAPYPTADEPTAVVAGPDGPRIVRRSASVGQRPYEKPAAPRSPAVARPGDFEKKADFLLEGAETAAKTLSGYRAPARTFVRNVPLLGNYGLRPEDQVAQQAAETLSEAFLRLTSGATITDADIKSNAKTMIQAPGDSDQVLLAKARRREQAVRAIRRAAAVAQAARQPGATVEGDAVADDFTEDELADAFAAGLRDDAEIAAWIQAQRGKGP